MAAGPILGDPSKNRALEFLAYFVVVAVAFGGGMALESHVDAQTAASVKLTYEQELKQAHEKADEQKRSLADTIAKEREDHAKVIQTKDANLAAVTKHATGVRTALETDLSAARSSGEACSARIAGISEALGGVFDSIGEVAVIAQDLGRENQQLKTSNKSLAEKLAGWQKWNAERTQRIVVTAQKNG
jgi:chromosome segregation ATPase